MERKLDTSVSAGGKTTVARTRFDDHLNTCSRCCAGICPGAMRLWLAVVLTARRARRNFEGDQS